MTTQPKAPAIGLLLLCALAVATASANDNAPATVQVHGDSIHYRGPITAAGVTALLDAHGAAGDGIQWLVIDSAGGEVNLAMDVGDWIHVNHLNVRITDRCLSACANYVFTAGQVKVIEPGAIVAWHGSAIQSDLESRTAIVDVIEKDVLPQTPVSERAAVKSKLLGEALGYLDDARTRQTRFFEKIGVDERITTVGEGHPGVKDFWFLSVAGMAHFGVALVVAPSDYAQTDTARFGDGTVTYIEPRPTKN